MSVNETLVELQLDVLNQVIEYKGVTKVIPESHWRDTLLPFLYPTWDTDKDKMPVSYTHLTLPTICSV